MTSSAISRPGQRERLSMKLPEVDWRLAFVLVCIAGVGTMMLYSAAPLSWKPWAGAHLIRFSMCFMLMLVLANNYLLLFVGWEGVGLCSYLLIGFYFQQFNVI